MSIEIPPNFLNEPAVILLDDERVEISGKSAMHEQKLVKKILKSGYPEEGAFRFSTNRFRKIRSVEGRAVYPDGREKIISSDDVVMVPDFEEYVLYSDQQSCAFRFPGIVAGTIIEVIVRREIENLVFWEPALFQRHIPVLTRRYTLVHPVDMQFSYHALLMSDAPSSKTPISGEKQEIVWERRDIEPFRPERMMPSGIEFIPALWFYKGGEADVGCTLELDSWNSIVKWYQEISKKSLEPGSALRAMVDTLCSPGLSEGETAAAIFRWVQSNLRYVAVYLGDDGFRPHETDDILANRYGDCKDKSAVLASALRAAGLEAYLVLVRTVDLGSMPGPFPSPRHFNHVIVAAAVDGDTIYLDPTCDTCSFGILPDMDQNAVALAIRDGEHCLTHLPCNRPRPNRSDVSIEAAVTSDGDASVSVTLEYDGFFAAEARRKLIHRKGKSRNEVVAAMLEDKIPALQMQNVMMDGEDPASDVLIIKVEGMIPRMLDTEKPYSFMKAVFNPIGSGLPDCRDRLYPIELGTPTSLEYDMSMILPDQWEVRAATLSEDMSNDYFAYSYSWNADGRNIRFSRRWANVIDRVPETDCADFRSRLEAVFDIEETMILVERK